MDASQVNVYFAGRRADELAWASKKLDITNPSDRKVLQDFFIWKQFNFACFLKKSKAKVMPGTTDEQLATMKATVDLYYNTIKRMMVVTPDMVSGEHPELVRCKNIKSFMDSDVTSPEHETIIRKLISGLMLSWFTQMQKYYTRVMTADETVFDCLRSEDSEVASNLNKILLAERWPLLAAPHKKAIMTFMHRCTLVSRILVGEPGPNDDELMRLATRLQEAVNSGADAGATDQANLHEGIDEGYINRLLSGDHSVIKEMQAKIKEFGGMDGLRGMLKSNEAPTKEVVREKAVGILDDVLSKIYD